jgi:IQ calmodulin-binding motif
MQERAAIKLGGEAAARKFATLEKAVVTVQRWWRGVLTRRAVAPLMRRSRFARRVASMAGHDRARWNWEAASALLRDRPWAKVRGEVATTLSTLCTSLLSASQSLL